jgi:hypothetical protein
MTLENLRAIHRLQEFDATPSGVQYGKYYYPSQAPCLAGSKGFPDNSIY